MKPVWKKIFVVGMFSIAMAALESAVVVYLRALYYPGAFTVAFKLIDKHILGVEILRELATLMMLGTVGYLCGKNFRERFAWFLISFAVWDIAYYAWLKILIDWPSSWFEWDILFLIPFTWLGPVLAPVICSLSMIVLAWSILRKDREVPPLVWTFVITGSAIILFTFLRDYGALLLNSDFMRDYPDLLSNSEFLKVASGYLPKAYSWGIFWVGELLIGAGIFTRLYNGPTVREIRLAIKLSSRV
jgi:hypothetical protein